jgi:hypothetical protein
MVGSNVALNGICDSLQLNFSLMQNVTMYMSICNHKPCHVLPVIQPLDMWI